MHLDTQAKPVLACWLQQIEILDRGFWCQQSLQTQILLKLHFAGLPQHYESKLDDWLKRAFENDNQIVNKNESDHLLFIRQILNLSQILLQDIKVPVFDKPRINEAIAPKGNCVIQVSLPWLDNLPTAALTDALVMATLCIQKIMSRVHDTYFMEDCFRELEMNFFARHQHLIPGAKSTVPILQEAHRQGHHFHHLGAGIYQLGMGASGCKLDRSANQHDSYISAKLASNKWLTTEMLRRSGIPVPRNSLCHHWHEALLAARQIGFPVVVKPVNGERGEGVSVGVQNDWELKKACEQAQQYSPNFLVEQTIQGTCHRIAVFKDQFLYASYRGPKSIRGDGIHTVAELMTAANKAIQELSPPKRLPAYPDLVTADKFLQQQHLALDYIPKLNEQVPLRSVQSTAWGGDPVDVSTVIHPANIELAIHASQILGLELAGIDLISTDISRPYHETGARINEINFAPVLGRTHSFQRQGIRRYVKALMSKYPKVHIQLFIGRNLLDAWLDKIHAQSDSKKINQHALILNGDISRALPNMGIPIHRQLDSLIFNPNVRHIIAFQEQIGNENYAYLPYANEIYIRQSDQSQWHPYLAKHYSCAPQTLPN